MSLIEFIILENDMSFDLLCIKDDFLNSALKIILHKIGNIANVFSVNIEAFLSSSLSDISKVFIYRMKEASNSLNSFVNLMRLFLSRDIYSLNDKDFWETIISLIFSKNNNLSCSNLININNILFRGLSVIFTSITVYIKNIKEIDDKLLVEFNGDVDANIIDYLEKKGINYIIKDNSIFISS